MIRNSVKCLGEIDKNYICLSCEMSIKVKVSNEFEMLASTDVTLSKTMLVSKSYQRFSEAFNGKTADDRAHEYTGLNGTNCQERALFSRGKFSETLAPGPGRQGYIWAKTERLAMHTLFLQ